MADFGTIEEMQPVVEAWLKLLEGDEEVAKKCVGLNCTMQYVITDLDLTFFTDFVDGKVKATGNTSMSLPDTQSPSWANFSFTLSDALPDSNKANSVSVKISTSGPNGKAEYILSGEAH